MLTLKVGTLGALSGYFVYAFSPGLAWAETIAFDQAQEKSSIG